MKKPTFKQQITALLVIFVILLGVLFLLSSKKATAEDIQAHIADQEKVISLKIENMDTEDMYAHKGYFVHSIKSIPDTSLLRVMVLRKADSAILMALVGQEMELKPGDRVNVKIMRARSSYTGMPTTIYTIEPNATSLELPDSSWNGPF